MTEVLQSMKFMSTQLSRLAKNDDVIHIDISGAYETIYKGPLIRVHITIEKFNALFNDYEVEEENEYGTFLYRDLGEVRYYAIKKAS